MSVYCYVLCGFPKREDIPLYNLVQRPRSGVCLFGFGGRSSIRFTCHTSLESSDLEEFIPLLFWAEGWGQGSHIPCCPRTCCTAENDLELVSLQQLPPKCWFTDTAVLCSPHPPAPWPLAVLLTLMFCKAA